MSTDDRTEAVDSRAPARRKLGAFEIARDARVLPEEELLVHLFEIEGEVERLTHPRVVEEIAQRRRAQLPGAAPAS